MQTSDGIDLNALGNAIDSSFTRSSTSFGPAFTTSSVKVSMVGTDKLKFVYVTIVNMARERELIDSRAQNEKEADSVIEAAAKKVAADYKELSTTSLKLKRVSADTSLEVVNLNHFNQRRSVCFRRIAIFEMK